MIGKERALRLLAGIAAAAVLSGGSAWAISGGPVPHGNPHDTTSSSMLCQPGWGHGDTNHCHDGPPGVESTTTSTSTTASTSTSTSTTSSTSTSSTTTTTEPTSSTTMPCKPGWGYGDTNHCHSGPPGLNHSHHGGGPED